MHPIKYIFILLIFLLTGCLSHPKYYSRTQNLNIYKDSSISDARVLYKDKKYHSLNTIPIQRTYSDQEIIIEKEGYKDYHLKLTSQWTDEKWAHFDSIMGDGHDKSAGYLFFPSHTALCILEIGIGWLFLPWGVASDIYNIVIGAPSTLIINPWRKMSWDKNIILEPTEALKEKCHKSENFFISNMGCIDCNRADIKTVYASPEECSRCKYRSYYNLESRCSLSTKKIRAHEEEIKKECHKKSLLYTDKGCISCNEIGLETDRRGYLSVSTTECERCSDHHVGWNGHCERNENSENSSSRTLKAGETIKVRLNAF